MQSLLLLAAWAVGLLPVLGLLAVLYDRISTQHGQEVWGRRVLVGSMLVAAVAAVCLICSEFSSGWVPSGVLVSLISVGATLDFGHLKA